jgi:hypothetical protein
MTAPVAPVRTAWSGRAWAIYLGWIVVTVDASAVNLALPTIVLVACCAAAVAGTQGRRRTWDGASPPVRDGMIEAGVAPR